MNIPTKLWEKMPDQERDHFRKMSEEDVVARWQSAEGQAIQEKIIAINLSYGSCKDYL
jgi:hypothetical protein